MCNVAYNKAQHVPVVTKFRGWVQESELQSLMATEPSRHLERKSQPDEAPWRNGQVLTSAGTAGAGVRAEMKRELLNVQRNMWSTRGGKQSCCATRHLTCTMRVGVHQSQHGDVQRVPQLPHHQPAVHVRDSFTLERHHASHFGRDSLFFCLFVFLQETVFWGAGFKRRPPTL